MPYRGDISRKPTFGDIKVEEVTVEDSLDHTGHNGDHVKEAFKVETPDPVEEIEGSIQAQAEQVMGGDRLCFTSLADHEELRQDCHRLQVDGERPQDLMTDAFRLKCAAAILIYFYKMNLTHTTVRFDNRTTCSHSGPLVTTMLPTSKKEKSWLMRTERPPTGTTRNSTLKLSWLPS